MPTRRVWGHAPQENFEGRSSRVASDAIWDKIVVSCDKTITRFLGGGGGGGGGGIPAPV